MRTSPLSRLRIRTTMAASAVAMAIVATAYGCMTNNAPSTHGGVNTATSSPASRTTPAPTPDPTPTSGLSGSVGGGGTPSPTPSSPTVEMILDSSGQPRFSPQTFTVKAGTTVVFVNETSMPHTVTPSANETWWTSQTVPDQVGATVSVTFPVSGTFPYYCQYHQSEGMVATMSVQP